MSSIDTLTAAVARAATPEAKLEALVAGLADRIKATSNDQNIQQLARDLKAAGPAIVQLVAARGAV